MVAHRHGLAQRARTPSGAFRVELHDVIDVDPVLGCLALCVIEEQSDILSHLARGKVTNQQPDRRCPAPGAAVRAGRRWIRAHQGRETAVLEPDRWVPIQW